ncbi:hypothetical protein DACRYDRAFT_76019 [Dacryopinax primogenitus]|uniref:Peptidase M48 domain-containing protein n=1 Tax=Dacryopinax primogenitus (strain DJM 731) TaxID=1858805 RepID=M5G9P3_DACPD|nr:uncharacterized protein DACRYDRAFT_76019 [Dacryopinax primogenitus]EJU05000.1 hypothetical protein DACRYDRAFT_76019 [Dacryopinax primogenitus]
MPLTQPNNPYYTSALASLSYSVARTRPCLPRRLHSVSTPLLANSVRSISSSSRALIPPRRLHLTTKDLLVGSGLQLTGKVAWDSQRKYASALVLRVEGSSRWFHASGVQRAPPLLFWLVALLKSSAALNTVSTVARLTLSILPWAWFRERIATRAIRIAQEHPEVITHPRWAGIVSQNARWLGFLRWSVGILAITPVALIAVTCIASTERTPISGRWRMIMLSPEEEEKIHADLRGYGWYTSVLKQMTDASPTGSMPRILNPSDWRWRWVEETLRRLEAGINILPASASDPPSAAAEKYYSSSHTGPVPPPAKYPLLPRPRISQLVHSLPPSLDTHEPATEHRRAQDPPGHAHHLSPHAQLGPPYNVLIVDKPECNALSHGYGPAGAGGIVLYTGFLEEILRHAPTPPRTQNQNQNQTQSLWTSLLHTLSPPSPAPRTSPTQSQTEDLAVVLAHELSHLILSHHLESLSSSLIVTPTLLSMVGDVGRTLIFPLTMFFGPFLNDAVGRMVRVGRERVERKQAECTTRVLEVEADAVSARLLAYAGYDPRCAIRFWESRLGSDDLSCSGGVGQGAGGEAQPESGASADCGPNTIPSAIASAIASASAFPPSSTPSSTPIPNPSQHPLPLPGQPRPAKTRVRGERPPAERGETGGA